MTVKRRTLVKKCRRDLWHDRSIERFHYVCGVEENCRCTEYVYTAKLKFTLFYFFREVLREGQFCCRVRVSTAFLRYTKVKCIMGVN